MTTETETPTAGKSIELTDNVHVMSSEPEYRSILRLDSRPVFDTWNLSGHQRKRLIANVMVPQMMPGFVPLFATFGDLRQFYLSMTAVERAKMNNGLHELVFWRLSSHILCGCGMPKMLHRHHVGCERPGCKAFEHEPRLHELRRAFPDQISEVRGE